MNIKDEKNTLRANYRAHRAAIPENERKMRDAALCERLAASVSYRHAKALLAYAPIGSEIDITPLLRAALAAGKRVALPRSMANGVMHFHYVTSLDLLVPGRFGIMEPAEECEPYAPVPSSLCLVPGMVFDRRGYRIGYGGGYYDRFLRDFDGTAVGVVYRDFLVPTLPHGRYDLAVAAIATEEGIIPARSDF